MPVLPNWLSGIFFSLPLFPSELASWPLLVRLHLQALLLELLGLYKSVVFLDFTYLLGDFNVCIRIKAQVHILGACK